MPDESEEQATEDDATEDDTDDTTEDEVAKDDTTRDDATEDYLTRKHRAYIAERDGLIDAARESARTFDKAVLAFGSAVFGASIAFLKDVASKPQPYTLKWLAAAWICFAVGLFCALVSFLFSHRACMNEIEQAGREYDDEKYKRPLRNVWSDHTDLCNVFCVVALFVGLLLWAVFAIKNLSFQSEVISEHPQGQSASATINSREGVCSSAASPNPASAKSSTTPGS